MKNELEGKIAAIDKVCDSVRPVEAHCIYFLQLTVTRYQSVTDS